MIRHVAAAGPGKGPLGATALVGAEVAALAAVAVAVDDPLASVQVLRRTAKPAFAGVDQPRVALQVERVPAGAFMRRSGLRFVRCLLTIEPLPVGSLSLKFVAES